MALDNNIFYFLNNLVGKSAFFDTLLVFLAEYLSYILIVIFLLWLYFLGIKKSEKIKIFLVTTISIIVARLGITEIIRFFYHRPRPFLVLRVNQLIFEHSWSFPSGHSTFFFAMATAIYLYNKKWGIIFFAMAILMNISRIIVGVHYPSDILGGAIIGILVGYLVFYFAQKLNKKS